MPQIIDEQNRFSPETGVIPTLAPLTIELEDKKLLTYLKGLEKAATKHWNDPSGVNLKARREQLLKYLFGKQLIGKELKKYESEFIDNVIYEFEGMLKALAVSKMPDIVVEAGGIGKDPTRKETAELLTKAFDKVIESDKNKKDLGMMFKHMPVYLIAAKKYRWDASHDQMGDYVEEIINPDHILLDHTVLTSNPDEMLFIIHYVEKTAKEWAMLFPDKEEDIKKHVAKAHPLMADNSDNEDVLMAQKVRVAEAWYDWFDKAEDFDPKDNPKFNFTSGVCWMLSEDVLLGKSKNPNWDYEGHDVPMFDGQPVSPEMMEQIMLSGEQPQGFEIKKVFNNYFKYPKKPFIFMTFDQFLRSAIDETSRIEQVIPIQKSMDDVERQTDHMVKNHKGKHVWGSESGVTKTQLKQIDMDNPNADIVIKGNPREVHEFIQPNMPPSEMFIHIRDRRDRMFAKVGAHGATRGEVTTQVATTNQISREADFTKNDDLVNDTILFVSTESIKARLHIMKLRYTEEHWKQLAGVEEGKYLHLRLNNDSIDDGMEVVVKASTTDKLRAERSAQTMAQLGMIDPYYFYKDMNIPDPEGRAEALFLKETNPELWYKKIILKQDISELASQVTQQAEGAVPIEGATGAGSEGLTPSAPTAPSPTDTSNIATTPQGGQASLLSRIGGGIRNMMGGGQ